MTKKKSPCMELVDKRLIATVFPLNEITKILTKHGYKLKVVAGFNSSEPKKDVLMLTLKRKSAAPGIMASAYAVCHTS